jgi:hypothetical protein
MYCPEFSVTAVHIITECHRRNLLYLCFFILILHDHSHCQIPSHNVEAVLAGVVDYCFCMWHKASPVFYFCFKKTMKSCNALKLLCMFVSTVITDNPIRLLLNKCSTWALPAVRDNCFHDAMMGADHKSCNCDLENGLNASKTRMSSSVVAEDQCTAARNL